MIFRYCKTIGPNVEIRENFTVHFLSDTKKTSSGAQCTVACIEASPPLPTSAPVCMIGYDSVCISNKTTDTRTAYCSAKVGFIKRQ